MSRRTITIVLDGDDEATDIVASDLIDEVIYRLENHDFSLSDPVDWDYSIDIEVRR